MDLDLIVWNVLHKDWEKIIPQATEKMMKSVENYAQKKGIDLSKF